MSTPSFTLTNESVTIVWEGKPYTVQKDSPNFASLRKAITEEDWASVPKHLTTGVSIENWTKGKFTSKGSGVFYDGNPLPNTFAKRILAVASEGKNPDPLLRFWERLQLNPSFRSVNQLWPFLEHKNIPLTDDGCFLAYKGVNSNYTDCHTGKISNLPGAINQMPRNQISDDPNHACHEGFHVGALNHAKDYGTRIIVCKVAPEDVVCVPYDSSHEKMRVSKYEVIGNYGSKLPSTTFSEPVEAPQPISEEEEKEIEEAEQEQEVAVEAAKLEEKTLKRSSKKGYAKYDKMDMDALVKQPIEVLRTYASNGLQIVGASKIPGGKIALISRILAVRS